jgi:DNA-binding NarL/FixJ family response regulator
MPVKVLILEANPVARSFLCRVVRESFSDTIHITEVGNLEGARRELARVGAAQREPGAEPLQLILVDMELPDGNAMELLVEMQALPALKIATTLYADADNLFPALQCGADGYLLKEDRFEVLVEGLQKIVRGQPPLSPAIARRLLSHFRNGPRAGNGRTGEPVPLPDAVDPTHLTAPESEVLTHLSKGYTIKEIASLMGLQRSMVKVQIKAIYRKLWASSRAQAALPGRRQAPS